MYLPARNDSEEWFGIVIAIPEPWLSEITKMRLDLGDSAAEQVPPHVTIMPPIALPSDDREQIVEHLRKVVRDHRPFRISLQGSGTFMPVSPVVYLNVDKGASQCSALAEDVRSGPLDYRLRFPYHPHVTLAHNVPEDLLQRGLEDGADFEASWMVSGVRLDRIERNGSYVSAAIFDF